MGTATAAAQRYNLRWKTRPCTRGVFVAASLPDGSSLSTSLLQRIKLREPEAWDRLVTLYGPLVYSWSLRAGLQQPDADDVVQEVFRTVLLKIADFRRERAEDTFRGWLWVLWRNRVREHQRRQRAQPRGAGGSERDRFAEIPESLDDSSAQVGAGELYQRALDLIRGEFEERSWIAFCRVVLDGDRPADVAADLGISANAVYIARSRILRRLREELGDA